MPPEAVRRRHARSDLLLSGVLALVTVVYGVQTFGLPQDSPNQADIGPRAYPLLILVLLAVTTALLALQATLRLRAEPGGAGEPGDAATAADRRARLWQLARLVAVVVATVIYLQLMITLGFVVATAAYVAAEVALVGGVQRYRGRRALIPIGFGCLASVAVYLLFADSLGVLLPRGIFAF